MTTFDAPGAGTISGEGTFPNTINGAGINVGYFVDSGDVMHGYERAVDGTYTVIDVPVAGNQGTELDAINASGEIAGRYIDSGGVYHGFLRSGSTGTAQTISFPTIPTQTYGNPAFTLSATATSGLPVHFAVLSGPATLSGSTLTITGAGSVTVQATQPGNGTIAAAPPVDQTFAVDPALLTASANDEVVAHGLTIPTLTGTLTGVVGSDGITATFSTTATISSPVGTYLVTPVLHDPGGRLGNYDVILADGALTIYNPFGLPLLLWTSPAGAIAGSKGYTLTVNGGNFTSNSRVLWNGAVRATVLVSSEQLTATILAADILHEETALVTVVNAAPTPATSSAQPIAVQSLTPVAKIASASLTDASHVLTLTGTDFVSGSSIEWKEASLATKYVSPWQISAMVPVPSLPASVVVANPAGTSRSFELQ
jgi:MBG domain (YGX type)